jgi:DNA-binding winged helix-turn-helix (wHTH) protein
MPSDSALPQTSIDLARRASLDLGGAHVEPSVQSVTGPQAPVTLEPRVMQVLLALVDAEGAVRRALRQAGLEQAVTVETIPRVGYRLRVVHGTTVTDPAPPALPASESPLSNDSADAAAPVPTRAADSGAWWWVRPWPRSLQVPV